MTQHLVILPALLPLIAGIIILFLKPRRFRQPRSIAIASLLGQLGLALALLAAVSDGTIHVYRLGDWPAPFGIVLVADRLAALMLLTTSLLALFALLYAARGTDTLGRHFHVLFQMQMFGLNGAFLTGDLFNLFVFFEILLLASYGLLLHGGGRLRTRAGLHFVIINLAGSTLFLFAVGTLYGVLGTLNMADLARAASEVSEEHVGLVRAAGLLLFGVFALKGALLPLHLWLPAAYGNTSAAVAALFAIMTKVGAYSILRVYTLIFGEDAGGVSGLLDDWLLPLALLSLFGGMLGVLASRGLREQIAYLIVASMGLLLTAFGIGNTDAIAGGLYYLPHASFAAAALFLLADSIIVRRGILGDRFESGPAIANPRLLGGIFFTIAVLIAGLPPLSGFLGKFLILRAALEHPALPWVFGVVLLTSLFAVIALARSGSLLFYRAQPAETPPKAPEGRLSLELLPTFGLLGLCVAMVIWAGPVHRYTQATAAQLLEPADYIGAVLGAAPTATTEVSPEMTLAVTEEQAR